MRKSSIPNLFTFANLAFGLLSIIATYNDNYFLAAIFIIVAGLIDRYDGRIARFLNVSSDLGKELDSLADLVSFGVAPSILTFVLYGFQDLGPYGVLGYICVILFPICGAFRLARYNASTFDGVFTGVPITIAGAVVALFVLVTVNNKTSVFIPVVIMIILSYLMISTFKLKKV
ncbi:CDP-diacylglycerol--serine O-phosphatidyltransferase [Clostridium sp. 'White wine YQ']|uniref:CDP-diacylglycerol--serine O-phosphatidyltransferase n=1 Tax=Clostridium sp. 'White wine YQ' TaxID=3027474 RepID=UPI002366557C|nr:CDP-diacylglycerol--serine O-phosphatidyltransferase [Clostridium sp. 'White wine YQ']MDD7792799.1 CDP-diacylglycerol--serine O-phosphatidyltransferase [Clostridium sp. 'White wine YQ']